MFDGNAAASGGLAIQAGDEKRNVQLENALDGQTVSLLGCICAAQLRFKFADQQTGVVGGGGDVFENR